MSEVRPFSNEAAKLLEISGSDTTAKEDCVDAEDVPDNVLSLAESRDWWGSSCHMLFATSILPYKRPYKSKRISAVTDFVLLSTTLRSGGCPRTPATIRCRSIRTYTKQVQSAIP